MAVVSPCPGTKADGAVTFFQEKDDTGAACQNCMTHRRELFPRACLKGTYKSAMSLTKQLAPFYGHHWGRPHIPREPKNCRVMSQNSWPLPLALQLATNLHHLLKSPRPDLHSLETPPPPRKTERAILFLN